MHDLDPWRLSTELRVVDAALLIIGIEPSSYSHIGSALPHPATVPGFIPVRAALANAVSAGTLKLVGEVFDSDNFNNEPWLDIDASLLSVSDIQDFLRKRRFPSEFFDQDPNGTDDANTRGHPSFAPKLYAANEAWRAVTRDSHLLRGKSPKQALEKWLLDHAAEFGLTLARGEPNKTAIEEICKIANWKPQGGATPTPGAVQTTPVTTPARRSSPLVDDDEIPF